MTPFIFTINTGGDFLRISKGCSDCLLSRVEYECRLVCRNEERIAATVEACSRILKNLKNEPIPAPVIASRIHRLAYGMIENRDPYRDLKLENNAVAFKVMHQLKGQLTTFRDLILSSIIANTLDYGSNEHAVTDDFKGFFRQEFKKGLSIDDTDDMRKLTRRVVYICDNCGEIVFDSLVLKYLKSQGSHISLAVRGSPILNDATMEDALELHLDKVVDTLTTTSSDIAELGVNMDRIPPELGDALDRCTLIIAKGMANYESLSEYQDLPPVGYMMTVKCEPIARSVGAAKGSRIALLVQ